MQTRCCHCREIKDAEAFCVDNFQPDGRKQVCRACASEIHKQWYAQNAEKRKAAVTAYRLKNANLIRTKKRERYRQAREAHHEQGTS